METQSTLFELGAIVFGLTEVIKVFIPKKYRSRIAPVISLMLGGVGNVYLNGYTPENVMYGLALGLAASGLYKAAQDTFAPTLHVNNTMQATSEKKRPSSMDAPV